MKYGSIKRSTVAQEGGALLAGHYFCTCGHTIEDHVPGDFDSARSCAHWDGKDLSTLCDCPRFTEVSR